MTDSSFKVLVAYAPDSPDDPRPYRARVYDNGSSDLATTVWGTSRDLALLHAREWIRARSTHGDPEEFLLDRHGDLIAEPDRHSVKVDPRDPPEVTGFDSDTTTGRVRA